MKPRVSIRSFSHIHLLSNTRSNFVNSFLMCHALNLAKGVKSGVRNILIFMSEPSNSNPSVLHSRVIMNILMCSKAT